MKEQMKEAFESIKSCYSSAEQGAWENGFEQGYQAAAQSKAATVSDEQIREIYLAGVRFGFANDVSAEAIEKYKSTVRSILHAQQPAKDKTQVLVEAVTEALRVLESNCPAIVDVVWTTKNNNETLWEHLSGALEEATGIEYKQQEQLKLAIEQPAQEPVKCKLVPLEPTKEMLEAAWEYHASNQYATPRPDAETDAECYRAMIAAAPTVEVKE